MLNIAHIVNKQMPPPLEAGGVNRMVEWLARAQHAAGHKVHIISPAGFDTNYASHRKLPVNAGAEQLRATVPAGVDIVHHHGGYALFNEQADTLKTPFIQTVHGNLNSEEKEQMKAGRFPNAVFVSKSHMTLHHGNRYVLNGIPLDEYRFEQHKKGYLLFLAKVRRSKKGVETAIRLATQLRHPLIIAGGWRLKNISTWLPISRYVKSVGFVAGKQKQQLLAEARALLSPIDWDEPFGLTVIEALASGTPVITFDRGAMSELLQNGRTGFVCRSLDEMRGAIDAIEDLDPSACRQYACDNFSIERVCRDYDVMYADAVHKIKW